MNAEFYTPMPRSASRSAKEELIVKNPRARRFHRWIAVIFTVTVAANFVAMP